MMYVDGRFGAMMNVSLTNEVSLHINICHNPWSVGCHPSVSSYFVSAFTLRIRNDLPVNDPFPPSIMLLGPCHFHA